MTRVWVEGEGVGVAGVGEMAAIKAMASGDIHLQTVFQSLLSGINLFSQDTLLARCLGPGECLHSFIHLAQTPP